MIIIMMKKCLILLLILVILHQGLSEDPTTCMTDFEENDELHFVCFCHDNYEEAIEEQAKHIAEHQGFSLAHFAYNLAGSYFGKSVHIVFQSCRHLKLVLDHSELSRIGSDLFRPDIQLRELKIEQVYHLELLQSPPRKVDEFQDEYLIAFPSEALEIKLYAVALVKLDAGAKFSELKAISEDVRLYIDLNQGHLGDEDNLNIRGFMLNHICFITRNQKIPLHEVRQHLSSSISKSKYDVFFSLCRKGENDNLSSGFCVDFSLDFSQQIMQDNWIEKGGF